MMDKNDITVLIPRLIKRVRKHRGISQEDLALRADLDRTYISGIERGVRNISILSLAKVLSALEIDIKKLAFELLKEEEIVENSAVEK